MCFAFKLQALYPKKEVATHVWCSPKGAMLFHQDALQCCMIHTLSKMQLMTQCSGMQGTGWTSLQWGAWSVVGMAAASSALLGRLQRQVTLHLI